MARLPPGSGGSWASSPGPLSPFLRVPSSLARFPHPARSPQDRGRLAGKAAERAAGAGEVAGGRGIELPLKAALTAGGLSLAGDTIAQLVERWKRHERIKGMKPCCASKALKEEEGGFGCLLGHDLIRSLRMFSYGFLLYGPGSFAWYSLLERQMPAKTVQNLASKIVLNQVILGPCVLAVVFSWNFLWMGKVHALPDKLKRDYFPSLVDGWKFWVPASAVNFAVVPLNMRVLWMSSCAVFWNFYLSTTVQKK